MAERTARSREMWRLLEPIHAVAYFSPEPVAALTAAGFRGYWMGYFAGRAAPLGPAGADVVQALFYNFDVDRVRRALPDAWDHGSPDAASTARRTGSVEALRRLIGADSFGVERAAELALRAALGAPVPGHALYAAYRALPVPSEPLAQLWHAATLLREHRGDGHVAALLAADIGGRESHVLISAAGRTPREVFRVARDFGDAEWARCRDRLALRGLLTDDGLTEAGRSLVTEVERTTDALADHGYTMLDDAESDELLSLLEPIARVVVAGGEIPLESPMGLDLRSTA